MSSAVKIIVPARLQSTRLPDKPLLDIAGKPMIVRTLEAVAPALRPGDQLIAAVDDTSVAEVVMAAGHKAVMTDPNLASGTDRCAALAQDFEDEAIVVNVQGDEPLLPHRLVGVVAGLLRDHADADMATLAAPMEPRDIDNPHIVKAVRRADGAALYFSRAPIPYDRDGEGYGDCPPLRHIGLYAYRAKALRALSDCPQSPMETLEKLEQLRALDAGMTIQVGVVQSVPPHGVDTPHDLEAVRRIFEAR